MNIIQKPLSELCFPFSPSKPKELENETLSFATKYLKEMETLLYILETILRNPKIEKFRSIKMVNSRFAQVFGKNDQLLEKIKLLMLMMGFEEAGEWLILPPNFSSELIQQVVTLIKTFKTTEKYSHLMRSLERSETESILKQKESQRINEEKSRFKNKLPPVPREGEAGTTRVTLTIEEPKTELRRNFAADDTLNDLLNWIGSENPKVHNQILKESMILVDETFLEKKTLNLKAQHQNTLFSLGFWPSVILRVA